ncbi:hypothetical protein QL285_096045 [Trifolium repens]|nr:hypothetical protein QL285_096045 [Trifolium repens]
MRLSSEDKEPSIQAQVFIATRQSRKGKELDKETNSAIIKLQDMIEKHEQPSSEAFQKIKKIAKLKREHADEVKQLMQEMEEKRRQDKEASERKFQLLFNAIVNQNTANLDIEAIAACISAPTVDANRASTSTHAPNDNEMMNNDDINEEMQDYEDEEM